MEIQQLIYFCSAAELENFTLAAKRHYIPQSAISITIKKLENELGTPLFDRVGNKVILNETGATFYQHAKRCIEEMENAKNSVIHSNEPIGEVRLLVLEERRIIADIIPEFTRKYPKISFTICHNLFEQSTLPFDIRISSNCSQDSKIISHPIMSENLMLAVAKSHPLASQEEVDFSELIDEKFIMMPSENSLKQLTEQACKRYGFLPKKSILCDDPFCIRKYVSAGIGISIIPPNSWKGLWDDNIILISLKGQPIDRTTYIECHQERYNYTPVKLFYDYCVEKLKNNISI